MAQVHRRPITAEARVRTLVSPCGICGRQNGIGTGFLRVLRFFPVIVIHLWPFILILSGA
jgi:hypothetical protein